MSVSDWDEIKRLASDFQRAQLTSSLQKLSERNCVEVINKLKEFNLINLVHTTDGKEYLTLEHLSKEIGDELYIHNGRVNFSVLSTNLRINYEIIEQLTTEIFAKDSTVHIVQNEILSKEYLDSLAEEINEKLQHIGTITIGTLANEYDLPDKFLLHTVKSRIGSIILGEQDSENPEKFFTETFVAKHKYQVRGILFAITKPTLVMPIIHAFNLDEKLFFNIAEKYISSGIVNGSFSGGSNHRITIYAPRIYVQAQYNWAKNFLDQNDYIEYDALKRIGVTEPKGYVKRNFSHYNLIALPEACIKQSLLNQIEAMIEDAVATGGTTDVYPYLPQSFSLDMCERLINMALDNRQSSAKASGYSVSPCHIFCQSIVVSESLITRATVFLENMMPHRAEQVVQSGAFRQQLGSAKAKPDEGKIYKKEERRRKAAGGKAGGGTQGRETKTKSTKKAGIKGRPRKDSASDDEQQEHDSEIDFLSVEEIMEQLAGFPEFEDSTTALLEEIANDMREMLSNKFQEVARAAFISVMSTGADVRKRTHQHLQEKVTALLLSIKLAAIGLKVFDTEIEIQLRIYLLKSHCTTFVDEIVRYLAEEYRITINKEGDLGLETRLKIINRFPDATKSAFISVHKCLTKSSIDDFLLISDDCLAAADILLKKKDNKKDRQTLCNHRALLLEQLNAADEPATCLHLACLSLFQSITGNLLQASGKFVPHILTFLKPSLNTDLYDVLHEFQTLVMKTLTNKGDTDVMKECAVRLEEMIPQIKQLTISFKKTRETPISEE